MRVCNKNVQNFSVWQKWEADSKKTVKWKTGCGNNGQKPIPFLFGASFLSYDGEKYPNFAFLCAGDDDVNVLGSLGVRFEGKSQVASQNQQQPGIHKFFHSKQPTTQY